MWLLPRKHIKVYFSVLYFHACVCSCARALCQANVALTAVRCFRLQKANHHNASMRLCSRTQTQVYHLSSGLGSDSCQKQCWPAVWPSVGRVILNRLQGPIRTERPISSKRSLIKWVAGDFKMRLFVNGVERCSLPIGDSVILVIERWLLPDEGQSFVNQIMLKFRWK